MDSCRHTYRLYKREKLCSVKAIDSLFSQGRGNAVMAYPLRVVWRRNETRKGSTAQFLITVPKKRLHNAVDRVLMRRRIRESYRLNRQYLEAMSTEQPVDMAFIYVADSVKPYSRVEGAMIKALKNIARQSGSNNTGDGDGKTSADNV